MSTKGKVSNIGALAPGIYLTFDPQAAIVHIGYFGPHKHIENSQLANWPHATPSDGGFQEVRDMFPVNQTFGLPNPGMKKEVRGIIL